MIRLRKSGVASAAFAALLLLPLPLGAQGTGGTLVRGYFSAYRYYEDEAATRNGIPTFLSLSSDELSFVRRRMSEAAAVGFASLARRDEEHWIGLELIRGVQLLRVRDATNLFNGRFAVDMSTGALTVLRGVDYSPFNTVEDATITAFLGLQYFRRSLTGDPFPAELRVPQADLEGLGLQPPPATATPVAGTPAAQAAAPLPPPVSARDGYLRIWSNADTVAGEMFGADKFGSDAVIESGDFAQIELAWSDAQGGRVLSGAELQERILGRARLPENPLRVDELAPMLAEIASSSGGLDVTIHSSRVTYYIPSTPPAPSAAASPAGAMDPALETFRYLQGLSLLAGDYSVVPQAAMTTPGFSDADLELYWWARMQRTLATALYPPLIDSGGKLGWGELALFATAELRRLHVPSMILVIRRPGPGTPRVPYHAVCVFQVGASWRWMDGGTFGDQSASDWRALPAQIYGKDVVFRVVDVAREWLLNRLDESQGWMTSRL